MKYLLLVFMLWSMSAQSEQWSNDAYQRNLPEWSYGQAESVNPRDRRGYGSAGRSTLTEQGYYYDRRSQYDPVLKQPRWRKEGCGRHASTLCGL